MGVVGGGAHVVLSDGAQRHGRVLVVGERQPASIDLAHGHDLVFRLAGAPHYLHSSKAVRPRGDDVSPQDVLRQVVRSVDAAHLGLGAIFKMARLSDCQCSCFFTV